MYLVIFLANTNKTTQWLKILRMNKIQLQRLKEYLHDLKKDGGKYYNEMHKLYSLNGHNWIEETETVKCMVAIINYIKNSVPRTRR